MIRAALVFLVVVSGSASAADWSKWSTWSTADPRVKSTAAFASKYGAGPSSRSSTMFADGVGGVTLNAKRGFNGVFEVSKNYPLSRAQVAAMARGAARAFGYAGLAAVGASAIMDAFEQAGIGWDPDVGDWTYPSGTFYYEGYPEGHTPGQFRYRMGNTSNCYYMTGAFLTIAEVDAKWKSCSGYAGTGSCHVATSYGYYSSGQFKRASCPGGAVATIAQESTACVSPQVYLPDGTCGPVPSIVSTKVPATDTDMETAVSDATAADPSKAPAIADHAARAGQPIPYTPSVWTGPSSVPGESSSSTSTGPAGTTTTTRVVNHGISYGPGEDDITVTDDETVTTTAPDGQTTTTTTTTTGTTVTGGDAATSSGSAAANPCALNPNASGCAPLGEVEDIQLQELDLNVDFSAPSVAGSCPAPIILPVLGTDHELKWDPLCEFAERTSPIVRAMAILSAGIWVIFMFRRG